MQNDKKNSEWLSVVELVTGDAILYDLLKYCPLAILRRWQLQQVRAGTLICQQNEVCDEFHLIAQGNVDVFIHADDGRKYLQARYHAGDMLGELEIFEQRPYICSVEATSEVQLLTLSRADFCHWLTVDNYFNQKIIQSFSSQYYQLSKKAGEDSLYSLHQRVCHALWQSYQHQGAKNEAGITINKQQLSEQFAVAPRSINRILFELREQHIITVNGERIAVVDPVRLHQQAGF
ncbi:MULTISPECIES: Crp/Fnr family transcriptional regulator [unclassified Serratia (in: enterobacteria)]|uniref:Crp/Fnr family transcriptional regulator n=1 Tax=unclassified Serratia (in: enterobacteria) TaxID=2647522 RepID=UPI00046A95C3|nr:MULTISPECIES: Crp/Fnr family transcriptional regulator [unclassified Serratia (in: enterobacteria)]